MSTEDVNQDKSIGEKEFALLLQNLEFREILSKFGEWLRYSALPPRAPLALCSAEVQISKICRTSWPCPA